VSDRGDGTERTKRYVLAVDLGTGGPKVAVVSLDGRVIGSEFESVELLLLDGGGVEQRPADWWMAIMTAAKRLLARNLVPAHRVVAIACTGQWSGTVAVDRDGTPLMNAVIWMDTRGSGDIRRIVTGTPRASGYGLLKARKWIRSTAGVPGQAGKDPIAHILFIRRERPEVHAATYKYLEPVDWLNQQFTGRFVASYDSIATHWVTDNRDVLNVHYDDDLLRMAEIERRHLPDLVPSASVVGTIRPELAGELGLSPSVRVVTATGDVHSAAVGSGAVADFATHLYIGTSSWITCHVPFKKTDLFKNICSLPSAIPGRYLVADEHETAGVCLTFLEENLGLGEGSLEATEALAASVPPGSRGVMFTPWLSGERTPVDDATIRASFVNLSLQTTRGDLVRSVYEGVAFNTRWLLETVEGFVGRRLDPITLIGGGARSDLWCQIHADVLDRTILQAADPVLANVRGAALLAAVALGDRTVDQIDGAVEILSTHRPNSVPQPVYGAMYAEFVQLYDKTKGIFRRLNRGTGPH
jgi:xylulokinase